MEKMAFMCCDGMEIEPKPARWQITVWPDPIKPADVISMLNDDTYNAAIQTEEFWRHVICQDRKDNPCFVHLDTIPCNYADEESYDDDELPELEETGDYDVDFFDNARPMTGLYWWSTLLSNPVTSIFVSHLFPELMQSTVDEQLQLERYFWETCGKALMDRWREMATQHALRAVIAYIAYAPYFGKLRFLRIG